MPVDSLEVIHISTESIDPLLSFDSEWELARKPTSAIEVVVAPPQHTTPAKIPVSQKPRPLTKSVASRSPIVKALCLFLSGVTAGAILTLLFRADPPTNAPPQVDRVATEITVPPPAYSPPIEAVAVATTGARTAEPVDAGVYRGSLRVTSEPAGAGVFINGAFAGRTPLEIRMAVGSRAVRVTLDGYASWSRGVQIVANKSTTVAAQLRPATRP